MRPCITSRSCEVSILLVSPSATCLDVSTCSKRQLSSKSSPISRRLAISTRRRLFLMLVLDEYMLLTTDSASVRANMGTVGLRGALLPKPFASACSQTLGSLLPKSSLIRYAAESCSSVPLNKLRISESKVEVHTLLIVDDNQVSNAARFDPTFPFSNSLRAHKQRT